MTGLPRLAFPLPVFLLLADGVLQLALLVPQPGCQLEVLVADRGFLVLIDLLEVGLLSWDTSGGGACDARRARAPASSITSIALSGRNRSVMYRSENLADGDQVFRRE